jgi:hypothetical protein
MQHGHADVKKALFVFCKFLFYWGYILQNSASFCYKLCSCQWIIFRAKEIN